MLRLSTGAVDLERRQVHFGTEVRTLTKLETELLRYLASRPSHEATREQLLVDVWGYAPGVRSRTVDTTIRRLRSKIEPDPASPTVLRSVYGVGYRLEVCPEPAPGGSTGLVGRRQEVAAVEQALTTGRSVAVLGPGGVGKTRLALEVLQRRQATGGEVVLVDVASAHEPQEVAVRLARLLGVALKPIEGVSHRIGRALAARGEVLVVVDNLEQLPDSTVDLLLQWRAPGVQLLWTSRRRPPSGADVHELRVEPLTPEHAVALFVARAGSARPGFAPGPGDHEALQQLCEAVDRLPLGLELVAARLRTFDLRTLVRRLHAAPGWARGSATEGRHATLRAAVQWSWSLLPPAHQRVLAWCTTVVGGLDAEGAEALLCEVCDDPLEVIEDLCDASLLEVRETDGSVSWHLLETVRAFGDTMLRASDEERQAASSAHRRTFVERAERCLATLVSAEERAALWRLERDAPDLVRAGERCPRADGASLTTIALGLRAVADRIPLELVLTQMERAEHATRRERGPDHVRLVMERAALMRLRRGYDARQELGQTIERSRELGRQDLLARSLLLLGNLHRTQGRMDDGLAMLHEARAAAEGASDDPCRVEVHIGLGLALRMRGDLDQAREHFVRALALARALGAQRFEGVVLLNLASMQRQLGDLGAADRIGLQALEVLERGGDRLRRAMALGNRGNLLMSLGRLDEAQACLQTAADEQARLGHVAGEGHAALGLACVWLTRPDPSEVEWMEAELACLRARDALEAGSDPRGAALAVAQLATVARLRGDPARAVALLDDSLARLAACDARDWLVQARACRAGALIELGRTDEARAILDDLPESPDHGTRCRIELTRWLLIAAGAAEPRAALRERVPGFDDALAAHGEDWSLHSDLELLRRRL